MLEFYIAIATLVFVAIVEPGIKDIIASIFVAILWPLKIIVFLCKKLFTF